MRALAATLAILLCGALAPRADAQTCDLHHFKVALDIGLRANGVQNIGLALYANAVRFDQLLALGTA